MTFRVYWSSQPSGFIVKLPPEPARYLCFSVRVWIIHLDFCLDFDNLGVTLPIKPRVWRQN
jgi:uncharacterized RDD family membrane protein YckC